MCAICGIYTPNNDPPVDPGLLDRMTDAMAHRGPDGRGTWVDGGVGLGHRRLAIIDLEGGRQPMVSPVTGAVLTFNGEIYNYRELRAELADCGYRFRERSDTEVVLAAYETWGEGCLDRLHGMFAFAIWDAGRRRLFAARDRLGIKPFYYAWDGRTLRFASELKALLQVPELARTLSPAALGGYLRLQYVPGPGTIFKDVSQLSPGCFLTCDGGVLATSRYWSVPTDCIAIQTPASDLPGMLLQRVEHAVQSHMVSDVPVGAFLSGGIDSSLVVALMSRASSSIQTFSVGFKGGGPLDELVHARRIAKLFGTEHHEIVLDEADAISHLEAMVRQMDEPLADYAALPTYLVAKLAAQRVKVVLTGEGADELFGGYRRYLRAALVGRMRVAMAQSNTALARVLAGKLAASERSYQATNLFDTRALVRLLRPNAAVFIAGERADMSPGDLNRILARDLTTWLPEDLLVKVDRMTMLTSLEARVPYLDHELVELAMSISEVHKVDLLRMRTKVLLKVAAETVLPGATIHRKKHGFTLPVDAWLRGRLRPLARDLLLDPQAFVGTLFSTATLAAMLGAHDRGHRYGHKLWSLLVLEMWSRCYAPSAL